MGAKARRRQKYLPAKLLVIRKSLGLSQNEILRLIGAEDELSRTNISNYELGQREPPLFVVLGYARAAGVSTDTLIDDSLELPTRLIRGSRK
jgi:transcriptional regulator with XRE-family HTH domain